MPDGSCLVVVARFRFGVNTTLYAHNHKYNAAVMRSDLYSPAYDRNVINANLTPF